MSHFSNESCHDDDSVEFSDENSYYHDCGCLKLCDWDTHAKCPAHLSDAHARELLSNLENPDCRFCFDMTLPMRAKWLSERNDAMEASFSGGFSHHSDLRGASCVANERGRPASRLASSPRRVASASMGVPPYRGPARVGPGGSVASGVSSSANARGHGTGNVTMRQCSVGSQGAVSVLVPTNPGSRSANVRQHGPGNMANSATHVANLRAINASQAASRVASQTSHASRSLADSSLRVTVARPRSSSAASGGHSARAERFATFGVDTSLEHGDQEGLEHQAWVDSMPDDSGEGEWGGPSQSPTWASEGDAGSIEPPAEASRQHPAVFMPRQLRAMLPRVLVSASLEPLPSSGEVGKKDKWGCPDANQEKQSSSFIPAFPPLVEDYYRAMKGNPADVRAENVAKSVYSSIPVTGFHPKSAVVPCPEKEFISIFPATSGLGANDPKIPTTWGKAVESNVRSAWLSGLRATGVASTMNLLTAHLKCLASAGSETEGRHEAALEAVGIDTQAFSRAMGTPDGAKFAAELAEVGDHLMLLGRDLAREMSTLSVACSQARRLLWLHLCGVEESDQVRFWTEYPLAPPQAGLFGASKERVAELQESQKRREALTKELSAAGVKTKERSTDKPKPSSSSAQAQRDWAGKHGQSKGGKSKRGRNKSSSSSSKPTSEPSAKSAKPGPPPQKK